MAIRHSLISIYKFSFEKYQLTNVYSHICIYGGISDYLIGNEILLQGEGRSQKIKNKKSHLYRLMYHQTETISHQMSKYVIDQVA